MTFGNVKVTQKLKDNKLEKFDSFIYDHFQPNFRYILFLVDEKLQSTYEALLKKDINKAGIESYNIVTCISTETPTVDGTDALLTLESNWRNYVTFNGKKADCIIALGRAVRILNKSGDINFYDFLDDKFNSPRYFCGSKFVNGPDCWIYPAAGIKDLYPIQFGISDPTNLHTRFFRSQLQKVKKDDMSTNELDLRPYEIIVPEIKEEINKILNELCNSELLAVDTETDGFNYLKNKLGTIQLSNDGQKGYVFDWSLVDKRLLKKVLTTAKRVTLANAKFDIKFIWQNGCKGWYPTDDTTLLAHALNSWRPKGLKPSAIFYCGMFTGYDLKLDEAKKKLKVENYLQIPKQYFNKYAGLDPIVTWRVQKALDAHVKWVDENIPNEKIKEWTIEKWYKEVMIPNLCTVIDTEFKGIYFSKEQFELSKKLIEDKIKECKNKLAELWKVSPEFKFESTKELGQLFKKMGWPEVEQSKAGDYKTSDAVLTEYERLKKPGIKELKDMRSFNVALNTFITGWGSWLYQHEDGSYRIHPNCNCFGTESFRHAMNDPNFQQIPSGSTIAPYIKKLFTVPNNDKDNWFLVDADFRSLQMILAMADEGLNSEGVDDIAYEIYGPGGNNDAHSVTAYNTFCKPVHLPIIEIEDENGKKYHFGEEQKIIIKRKGVHPNDDEQNEITILGKEFTALDEFIKYA